MSRSAPLTEKQAKVIELREQGLTWSEVAATLEISAGSAKELHRAALMKMHGLAERSGHQATIEKLPPEQIALAIDRLTDPFTRLEAVAKECGLRPGVVKGLAHRLRVRFGEVNGQMKAIKTSDMIVKLDERINHALSYMDDYIMSEASFRDLAMGVAQLIEKRQLLKGEPTQIVSIDDRRALNDLIPLMLKEAERRGVTVAGESVRVPDAATP